MIRIEDANCDDEITGVIITGMPAKHDPEIEYAAAIFNMLRKLDASFREGNTSPLTQIELDQLIDAIREGGKELETLMLEYSVIHPSQSAMRLVQQGSLREAFPNVPFLHSDDLKKQA